MAQIDRVYLIVAVDVVRPSDIAESVKYVKRTIRGAFEDNPHNEAYVDGQRFMSVTQFDTNGVDDEDGWTILAHRTQF
jgi:hypothetical protein